MIRIVLVLAVLITLPMDSLAQRKVPVTIVTDEIFEEWPQWRGLVKSVVRESSKDFPELMGWKLEIQNWHSSEPLPINTFTPVLESMAREVEFNKGILIYFAGQQYVAESRRGFSLLDKHVLAVTLDRKREMILTLRHELGHSMGLPHIPGKNVMAELPVHRTWDFTPLAVEGLKAVQGMALGNAPLFFGADINTLRDVHAAWNKAGFGDARIVTRLDAYFNKEEVTTP